MNKSLLSVCVATIVLSIAPLSAPVASSAIQRCESADGQLVYTDKACAVFGAKAVPMSGELLTRIASEDKKAPLQEGQVPGGFADADTPLDTAVNVSRRSPGSGCARTPTQLAMDLRGALALGDVNRVAESYHWVGLSTKQGHRIMGRLQQLIGKQVVDSHYFEAQISSSPFADAGASWVATSNSIGGSAGILQVMLGNGASTSIVDFDVEQYADCYFVKF